MRASSEAISRRISSVSFASARPKASDSRRSAACHRQPRSWRSRTRCASSLSPFASRAEACASAVAAPVRRPHWAISKASLPSSTSAARPARAAAASAATWVIKEPDRCSTRPPALSACCVASVSAAAWAKIAVVALRAWAMASSGFPLFRYRDARLIRLLATSG